MKILLIYCVLCTFITIHSMENKFVMHEISNSNDEGTDIFSIDFDDDGDFDLLTAGSDCVLWINDGNGNFNGMTVHSNTNWDRSIRAADLDGDEDNDIIIASFLSNQIILVENTATGFISSVFDNTLVMPHSIDLNDLDSDGDVDILCSEFIMSDELSNVVWWENLGNLNFSEKNVIYSMFQQSSFVFADFINSDNNMDVVACGNLCSEIKWWENDGNQNFGDGFLIDPQFDIIHTIIGNDLDLDGDVDILGASVVAGFIGWCENDGEGNFTRHDLGSLSGVVWMDCADFDNDGDNDLFAVGIGPSCAYIYENLGDEIFEEYPLPGVFNDGYSATARDFDNDGDMDLAAIGNISGQICWWENKLIGVQFSATPLTGHIPLEVSFTDESNFTEPILAWFWDFENDGSFESNEQHPAWIYEETGIYSVRLVVLVDGETKSYIKEDYIQVFNGHTALEFNQSDSHILCSALTSTNLIDSFTIESWIYPYSFGPDTNFGLGRIFDKSAVSIYLSNQFPLTPEHSLVVQIQHADGTLSFSATPENSITLNEWIHVAIAYNGIDLVRMFVNGEEIMSSQPTVPSGVLEDNNAEDIYIGNYNELSKAFDGIIDEVRVWNSFKDEPEIQENMNKYLHGWETGLIHYWQFNEANGDMVFDTASNNDGAIFGTSWIEGIELDPVEAEQINIIHSDIDLKCYPNPFNPTTTISFELSTENTENTEIVVYNLKGQKVKQLISDQLTIGHHSVVWDGKDEKGKLASSGIYFYKLRAGKFVSTKKMILMK